MASKRRQASKATSYQLEYNLLVLPFSKKDIMLPTVIYNPPIKGEVHKEMGSKSVSADEQISRASFT